MKGTSIGILGAGGIILAAVIFSAAGGYQGGMLNVPAHNVSIVDGKQIVEIGVRGGYNPKLSQAKAGVPTVLRMETNGSYDCSSAISIPSLGIFKNLPPSGSTDIEIPTQSAGTRLSGTCAMGMYRFEIDFNA